MAPNQQGMAAAVDALRRGALVAFPTETVYGLGADATRTGAVRRIYEAKGRPPSHPLIVHLASAGWLDRYGWEITPEARKLSGHFWPGPLTLVVRRTPAVVPEAAGGLDTVGLRVPAHDTALALLQEFGGALAAPSANLFGRVSPTTAVHVEEELGDTVDVILDGGPCRVGVESTIVDCTGPRPRILRPGGISREQVEAVAECALDDSSSGVPAAPGTLPVHYAPRVRVILMSRGEMDGRLNRSGWGRVAVMARGEAPDGLPEGVYYRELPGGLEELARVLYAWLRELDDGSYDTLVVEPVEETGVGVAINDRLRRAAAAGRAKGSEK